MTTSDAKKILKQIEHKSKAIKFQKHNLPTIRKFGKSTKKCKRCGRNGAHISKYGLGLCRQCFRNVALNLGFKKFS
ncbi:MAG: 30S ribosomal protein S14 [Nanoarchaeota archaeon]|nr:30S ribosomal protein S14 [Nanoarchaeota archaeon]MBU1269141.1 30S ribosomal protein S14 [Nanoarchaeota archaeon]MBU1605103.1 30S ribosomal protein S14 [Nanoarchaeota archaeon]MBU2442784.1 30S ribosomal protein S14 [Nanoarchaeota archaeon]